MLRVRGPAIQLARAAVARNAPAAALVPTRHASSFTERNEEKGRPLSPHVTIYKFPPVAMSSIAVRATGVALTGGATAPRRACAGPPAPTRRPSSRPSPRRRNYGCCRPFRRGRIRPRGQLPRRGPRPRRPEQVPHLVRHHLPLLGRRAPRGAQRSCPARAPGLARPEPPPAQVWDKYPDMLTNESVEKLSYAMFGTSAMASAVFAAV